MACPQCEGPLEEYVLGESRAVHCERCGYVGIEVDHHPEPRGTVTSLAEAVERYLRER